MGGRTVKKETLVEVFTGLGFQKVESFRQSGNVVFEAGESGDDKLREAVEAALHRRLGYEVAVVVRTLDDLKRLVGLDPFKGPEDEDASFLVTMLRDPPARFPLDLPLVIPRSTAEVISRRGADVFSVTHGGGEGALPNPFLESKLKTKATTRNMNVLRDIVERFGELPGRRDGNPR